MKNPTLTTGQALDVRNARTALGASIADTDPARYPEHLGALEYHVQTLLDLIAELTGGTPTGGTGGRAGAA